MRELLHMNSVIEAVRLDTVLADFLEGHREAILDGWSDYPAIRDIRKSLGHSKEAFRTSIASNVLSFFFTVLRGENKPGDCPVMRSIVKEFYTRGLTVEDLFFNCTALKNVVLGLFESCDDSSVKNHRSNVTMILDHNLFGVLSIYSDMMRTHESELEFRNSIIQKNVLCTRTDCQGVILEATDAFCSISGYDREELIGKTHSVMKHPNVDPSVYEDLWKTITSGQVWTGDLANMRKDGSPFITTTRIIPILNDQGEIAEYMAFCNDITAHELAKIDPLTGLYNRRALDLKFQKLYINAAVNDNPLSVILADIDYFKRVNDTYGHHEGDELIKNFAGILKEFTRNSDICARWGGEEFMILLPGTPLQNAFNKAERIRAAVKNKLCIDEYPITCSFGVAQLEKGESIAELFKRIDKYLYTAKHNGRDQSVMQ